MFIKYHKVILEAIIAVFLSLLLFFFTYYPIYLNYRKAPPVMHYWGNVNYPIDPLGNLFSVLEGKLGHWRRTSKVTSTMPSSPQFVRTEYILVGQFARLFRLDHVFAYQLTKVMLSMLAMIVIYFLLCRIFRRISFRLTAYALVLFATGFSPPKVGLWKIATEMPFDALVFFRLTFAAHHYLLATITSLVSIYFLLKAWDKGRFGKEIILAIFFGLIACQSYSPGLVLVFLSFAVFVSFYTLREYVEKRHWAFTKSRIILAISYGLSALPVLYYRHLTQFWDMNTIARTEKMVSFNLLPQNYFYTIGLVLVFVIVSIWPIWKKGKSLSLFFLSTAIVHPVAVFLIAPIIGINNTRFYMTYYFVALGIIGAYGVEYLARLISAALKLRKFKYLLILFFLTVIFSSSFLTYQINSGNLNVCFCNKEEYIFGYPFKTEMDAFRWLAQNTKEKDIVLSGGYAGMMIPSFAGNFVYSSFWNYLMSPPNYYDTKWKYDTFFWGTMTVQEAQDFLNEYNISYVYHGPEERKLGGDISKYGLLEEVFANERVKLYQVKK